MPPPRLRLVHSGNSSTLRSACSKKSSASPNTSSTSCADTLKSKIDKLAALSPVAIALLERLVDHELLAALPATTPASLKEKKGGGGYGPRPDLLTS